jgi:hypothetical protein
MKVAQYEVLGNNAKRDVRPGRDGGSGDLGVRISAGGLNSLLLARLRRLGRGITNKTMAGAS